jgi:hypothetical protein
MDGQPQGCHRSVDRGTCRQGIKPRNKINASTSYDFRGKYLTPYGGLLPVATVLEKLGFHWSTRPLAQACGLSRASVHRIWSAFALQPHRAETFKLSKDPLFIEKVREIVGLYLAPPDRQCAPGKSSAARTTTRATARRPYSPR